MTGRAPARLLADCDWIHEPPPPPLVEGLGFTAGALVGIISAPGTGKTFLTLSIATAVAIAPDWLGHRIVAPGPVAYAVGEGQAAFPLRLEALRAAHGLTEGEPSGVFYFRESLSLLRPDDVTWLLDGIRLQLEGEALALVVFDPLAAFMAGGDENSTQDMSAVVAALNRIRAETGACVLITHHTGWNAERERGSTALRAAMDVMYSLKQEDGVLTLECTKLRDGVAPQSIHLRLRRIAESCVVDLATPTTAATVTQLTAKQQHVLDALHAVVVDAPVTYTRWKDAAATSDTTFDRTLALLVRLSYVIKYGNGRGARYAPPGPLPPTPVSPPFGPRGGDPRTPVHPHGSTEPGVGGDGTAGLQ